MLEYYIFLCLLPFLLASCPSNTVEWQSSCFIFHNQSAGFADANFACIQLGGNLASIHDGFTNTLLAQKAQTYLQNSTVTDFWIGLTDLIINGNWTWIDETSLDFNDWAAGEPEQNETSNCTVLSIANGRWKTCDCFFLKPYVCKVDANNFISTLTTPFSETTTSTTPSTSTSTSTTTTTTPPLTTTTTTTTVATTTTRIPLNCPKDFVYLERTYSCYGLATTENTTYWTAEQNCKNIGGHLASVHSDQEYFFIQRNWLYQLSGAWIGATSNDLGKTWKWSDGSPWDYAHWAPSFPDSHVIPVCLLFDNMGFADINCDLNKITGVCRIQY